MEQEELVESLETGEIINTLPYSHVFSLPNITLDAGIVFLSVSASFCSFNPHSMQHLAEQVKKAAKDRSLELQSKLLQLCCW